MYRRYYSYNDMPVPVTAKKPETAAVCHEKTKSLPIKKNDNVKENKSLFDFSKLKSDDLILIAVVFLLIMDDCDDVFLFIALAFIFVSGQKQ